MYPRLIRPPKEQSFFLFGPRGTGKSSWVRARYPDAVYVDLLDDETYRRLLARPSTLADLMETPRRPAPRGPKARGQRGQRRQVVVIDEVQKVPALLDEVHRQIEARGTQFVLTGSSARKLRKQGTNLLAGRAFTHSLFPLTASELGDDFDLARALRFGTLPMAVTSAAPARYLSSYAKTYLEEEVEQEGLTRQIGSFARFLETASFSQAASMSVAQIATDAQVHRKVVEDYFGILRDLLLSYELPVFSRRAKRELMTKRKFFFFDVGLYRTLRPRGPLDSEAELNGPAFETLCLQELLALNHYLDAGFDFFHWRTRKHQEVDLVLYGERGLLAFELKAGSRLREADLQTLELFGTDYPEARLILVYTGTRAEQRKGIEVIPAARFFATAGDILLGKA